MWVGFVTSGLLALIVVLALAFRGRAVLRFARRVIGDRN
jgi:hypothetical protein